MHASARWAAVALAAAVAACDNGAGPEIDPTFDARAVAEDYEAVERILQGADWPALAVLARGAAPAPEADGPAAAPLISDRHRGATFVYDPEAGDWVVDPDRDGAPANGVRFILYEEVAGVPDTDRERGWADLVDEGDGSAEDVALRLRVTQDGTVTLEYGLTADEDGGEGRITAVGFVTGDGERLDFDVALAGRRGGPNELSFDLAVDARDFSVGGEASGRDGSDDGAFVIAARHGDHRLDVEAVASGGTLDGGIDLDGKPFVDVAGTPAQPVFTRPDGTPLRPVEVLALLRVVDFVEDVFDLVEDVVDPVGELVLLGFLL